MAEHDRPQHEPPLPEDDEGHLQRQAGDRPVPTPGHIGHLPDDAPAPGQPVVFPPHTPED